MARAVTMRDVAAAAGVGVTTVSRVVNGDPTVAPQYAQRVRAAVTRLGFRPNQVGRDLRRGTRPATIGLVVEDLRNPFYSEVAYQVEQAARGHGALLVTGSSDEDPARERELVGELCQRGVDGLIVVPTAGDHAYCAPEIERGIPMVFLDRPPDGLPATGPVAADTVLLDNAAGAAAAARRLIGSGHRRIGVIGYEPDVYTVAERVRGFRAAMAEAGLAVDDQLLRFGSLTPSQGSADAAALLDGPDPPTALFCCNNRMTLGVVEELWRRQLQPHRSADPPVAVAGFDDLELSRFLPFPVTLVVYDVGQLARRAAELLFQRIGGGPVAAGPTRQVVVPTRVVTRGRRS